MITQLSKFDGREHSVYWIHKPDDSCIGSQGYIGVSVNPHTRFIAHQCHARKKNSPAYNYPICRAIRKYGEDLKHEIIFRGSITDAYAMEELLRPEPGISWNISKGGDVSHTLGIKQSKELIKKRMDARKGYCHSEETKRKLSLATKGKAKSKEHIKNMRTWKNDMSNHPTYGKQPWECPMGNKERWASADYFYIAYKLNPGISRDKLKKLVDCPYGLQNIWEKFRDGWIPRSDESWVNFQYNYLENT